MPPSTPNKTMPFEYTSRLPTSESWFGKYLSLPNIEATLGKSAKLVFAAIIRINILVNCTS